MTALAVIGAAGIVAVLAIALSLTAWNRKW